jgi:hypothetical protein
MRSEKTDHSLHREFTSKYPSRSRKKPSKFVDFSPIDSLIEDCDEPNNSVLTTLKPSQSRSASRKNVQEVSTRHRSLRNITVLSLETSTRRHPSRTATSATAPSPETLTHRSPSRTVISTTAPSPEISKYRRSLRIANSVTAPSPEITTLRRSLRITNNNVVNILSREPRGSSSHTSYSLRNNRRRDSK